MKINPRGYWEDVTPENHGHDVGLAQAILTFLKKESANLVVDVGCGDGWYTRYLNSKGIAVDGYDGNPDTDIIGGEDCYVADLSEPVSFPFLYDWAISLEVGEHIPQEFEKTFIDNVVSSCSSGIIISWSIPEYGGEGHVNPKPNDYIIEKISDLGYKFDQRATSELRSCAAEFPVPCYWFRKTLMVFRKD